MGQVPAIWRVSRLALSLAAFPSLIWLQGDVAEEVRHRFAIMGSADGLSEDHGDVNDLGREKTGCHEEADADHRTHNGCDVYRYNEQRFFYTFENKLMNKASQLQRKMALLT